MRTTIQHDKIKISVNAFGAELVSLVTLQDDTEMLWQADEKFWASQSPTLFPFVGRLENERYEYEGKAYHLYPIHQL